MFHYRKPAENSNHIHFVNVFSILGWSPKLLSLHR